MIVTTRTLRPMALLAQALLTVLACGPNAGGRCEDDDECGDAQICDDGFCQDDREDPDECTSDAGCAEGEGEGEGECEGDPCQDDRSCPGGYCDLTDGAATGCCVSVVCLSDSDCADAESCDVRRGICVGEDQCDPGDGAGCADGDLCVYVGGAAGCVSQAPPAAACAVVVAERVVDDGSGGAHPAVVAAGASVQLSAVARAPDGKLVPHAAFAWSGAGVSANGLVSGACDGPAPCFMTATATTSGASCDGVVKVYPARNPNTARVVLLDLASGAPLANAPVAADFGGGLVEDSTDADGVAVLQGNGGALASLSVFPSAHQWHTVLDAPPDTVIYSAAVRNPTQAAGIKGTIDVSAISTLGDIALGFAGVSRRWAFTDITREAMFGEARNYMIEIEGVTDPGGQLVSLPMPLVMQLGATDIKREYIALGDPGPAIGWAMAGKMRLSEIGPIISALSQDPSASVTESLVPLAPMISRFDHAVVTDLGSLTANNRPPSPGDGVPEPYEDWSFPELTPMPDTFQTRAARYAMPSLPCAPGGGTAPACAPPIGAGSDASPYARGAFFVVGALVPSAGLVPLGMTSAVDDYDLDDGADFDGLLSYSPDTLAAPADGTAIIDAAPAHDGLEGLPLVTIAIALDVDQLPTDGSRVPASTLTHLVRTHGASENAFPAGAFLEAQGGTFSPSAGAFALSPVGEADFYRVTFDNGAHAEWNVWFSDPTTTIDTASLAPASVEAARRIRRADVHAFRLGAGYGAVTGGPEPGGFDELFRFDGADLDNLVSYVGAWSSQPCEPARVIDAVDVPAHCTDIDATPVPGD